MRRITVTHVTLKVPAWVMVDKIFYIYRSANNDCTHIVSDSGLICPAAESEAEVFALIDNATNKEVKSNGTPEQTSQTA